MYKRQPADSAVEPSAELFTYGDENGLKSDSEIFDGEKMIGWTMSNVNSEEPLFRTNAQDMGNGETAYTLVRRTGAVNNIAGYVTYRVPAVSYTHLRLQETLTLSLSATV